MDFLTWRKFVLGTMAGTTVLCTQYPARVTKQHTANAKTLPTTTLPTSQIPKLKLNRTQKTNRYSMILSYQLANSGVTNIQYINIIYYRYFLLLSIIIMSGCTWERAMLHTFVLRFSCNHSRALISTRSCLCMPPKCPCTVYRNPQH